MKLLEKFFRFIFSGAGPLPQIDAGLRQLGNDQPSDPGLSEKTPLYTKVGVVLLRMLALAIVAAIVAGVIAFALRARSRSRARALGEGQVSTVGSVGEDINALLRKNASVIATSLRGRPESEKAAICSQVERNVWPWVHAGVVRPIIDRVLPLKDAA